MTPLDRPLRRQIDIDGTPYTLTLDPRGIRLTKKAHRHGIEFRWRDLINGDVASLHAAQPPDGTPR
jgi:hypothetical protein